MSRINFLPPWVETTLQPAFYDKESGTVLQQTARMYAKVNQLIRSVNDQNETIADYIQQFIDLKDYCEDYFENLDVQEEINHKLDAMAENGTLTELIGNYVDPIILSFKNEVDAEINRQNVEITNQNTAIESISTTVSALAGSNPIPVTSVDDMTDTSKIYVLTTDGYWYYYDGDSWEQGGLFQSPQDSNLLDENVFLRDKALGNVFGKNLFNNVNEYIIVGKYLSSTGFVSSGSYICSHPILVKAGTEYSFTTQPNKLGSNKTRYAYVDSSLDVISVYDATADDVNLKATFTAPTDGYVVFNLYHNDIPIVFSKSSDYTTELTYGFKNEHLSVNIDKISGKLPLSKLSYYDYSVNLFDKNSDKIISDKYITGSGYSSATNYHITHPIYLSKGDVIHYPYDSSSLGNNTRYAKCTIDGTFVEAYIATLDDDMISATIPSSGYYCFNLGTASYVTFMLVANIAYPDEYVSFKSDLYNVHIPYLDQAIEDISLSTSPIYGKKIGLTGDSICSGVGYSGGYGRLLHDTYNMTVNNIGVGGGTIASGTVHQDSSNRFWINESITSLDSDCDYVLLEGGVNDSSLGVTLGTLTTGYNDVLDTDTYYGAFENMLKQLITRFAGKKYAYLAVHQMTNNYRVTNSESSSYYWASKKCCEKWGVPFIDINSQAPAFGLFSSSMGSLYTLRQNYTKDGDGWHPNEDGYTKYYLDKIVAGLEDL